MILVQLLEQRWPCRRAVSCEDRQQEVLKRQEDEFQKCFTLAYRVWSLEQDWCDGGEGSRGSRWWVQSKLETSR